MSRRSTSAAPECDHVPIVRSMDGHPDFVSVECAKCGATTGYTTDMLMAWTRWRAGDVIVLPEDILEDE